MFDEVIIRLANDIVNEVNNNNYDGFHDNAEFNTIQGNSDISKVSKNLRYQQQHEEI